MAVLPGKRVRDNSIFGILTGALTSSSTSMASTDLDSLTTIVGDHAMITLDPFRQFGDPEIVMVTGHPVGSTVASIQRGMYNTVARSHGIGVQWAHAATVEDYADVLTSLTRPTDQYEGQVIYQTDTDSYVYFDGVSWRALGAGSPNTLAYAEVTANQGGIVGSNVDLTGLSVSVTVPAGRRIKISSRTYWTSTTTDGDVFSAIFEGGTQLQESREGLTSATNIPTVTEPEVILTPTAGTHTYKLVARRIVGTGTLTNNANAQFPSFILVQDITGTETPFAGNSTPIGQIGQTQVTTSTTGITTVQTIASVNVVVPAGRVLKISIQAGPGTSDGTSEGFGLLKEDGATIERWWRTNDTVGGNTGDHHSGFAIVSPTAGAHTYTATLERLSGAGTICNEAGASFPTILSVVDITPTPTASSGAPSSTLAYSEVTTNPSGSFTAETEIVRATFTVPAGRRIKVTAKSEFQVSNTDVWTAGDIRISTVGGTGVGQATVSANHSATQQDSLTIETVITPAAGTHTYLFTMRRAGGTGTITPQIGTNVPAFILVEDITGSVWPAGSQVTSGIIASEAWLDWSPTLTALTVGSGIVVAKYLKVGRTVHYRFSFTLGAGSAVGSGPEISLPVPANAQYLNDTTFGTGTMLDTGVNVYMAFPNFRSGGTIRWRAMLATGTYVSHVEVSSTVPFTWASGDTLSLEGTYEAAS